MTIIQNLLSFLKSINWDDLGKLFLFDPQKPLLFTQLFFWIFLLIVLVCYSFVYRNKTARNTFLFLVSIYFYYKCGGILVILLLLSIVITWLIGIILYKSKNAWWRKFYVALSVVFSIGMLSYFKYTYLIVQFLNDAFSTHIVVIDYLALWSNQQVGTHFDISIIILPVGISFFTFQALSYIIDLYRRKTLPVFNIIDFGFYKSFFPQLVAGPIVRAAGFVPQMYAKYSLTSAQMGYAVFLILKGLIKKMIISDYISINFVDRVFDNPLSYSGFENMMAVFGYSLQIYCDFSGYTDIAIGVALLLGFRLPLNFNSPYKAANLIDFWRRWHISLSSWLRDYLYIPLGGNKNGKLQTCINLLITMVLGGLWHGANFRFVLWGALHGIGLIFNRIFIKLLPQNKITTVLSVVTTFLFVCFTWIFFRAKDMQTAYEILAQIFGKWDFTLIPTMIVAYQTIFALTFFGFVIHWLPSRFKEWYRGLFIKTPIVAKVFVVAFIILVIFQFKTSALQPFIYFQF